jgi:hypothetical protein
MAEITDRSWRWKFVGIVSRSCAICERDRGDVALYTWAHIQSGLVVLDYCFCPRCAASHFSKYSPSGALALAEHKSHLSLTAEPNN